MRQFRVTPKTPIKASSWYEPEFKGTWSDEEIELWKNTDWGARDYKELPVDGDTFTGDIVIYGNGEPEYQEVTFQKFIRPNSIFPPYYRPVFDEATEKYMNRTYAGPMGDGTEHNGYSVHDRYETYELYEILSR